MTNGQAVMHYNEHRLTALVTTWLRARTRHEWPMGSPCSLIGQSVCQKL